MNDALSNPTGGNTVGDPVSPEARRGDQGLALLPEGSRDVLPARLRRRRFLASRLLETFEGSGYRQVATPIVEYFEVVGRGLSQSDRDRAVRFLEAGTGELVALRADVTPQIARLVGAHRGREFPSDLLVRLCYAADLVRQPTTHREAAEQHQVGVELIGDPSPAGDGELVSLCDAALRSVGITGYRFDLADIGIAKTLMARLDGPPEAVAALHSSLAKKDPEGTARVLRSLRADPAMARAIVGLCEVFGGAEVLSRARQRLAGQGVDPFIDRLEQVLAHVCALSGFDADRIRFDLGEVRGFDYYTGFRLRVWAPGVSSPVVRGGRYDDLLGRYGEPAPATGFAFDLDALESAAEHGAVLGTENGREEHLVVVVSEDPASVSDPDAQAILRRAAARVAEDARLRGEVAGVQVGLSRSRAEAVAATLGATFLSYVALGPGGVVRIESMTRTGTKWAARRPDEGKATT